jgi:enterochelin esterase-like enzyme
MRFVTVQSPALGGRGDLAVYVPPGHAASPDLPVVVLLHGVYGSFWNWAFNGGAHVVMADLMSDGAVGPMALLMPSDGLAGEGTAYLSGPTADYGAWVMDDALACAGEAVAGITDASPLFLCGASMGAYRALRLGAHHADRVLGVSAHSTVPDLASLAAFVARPIEPPRNGSTAIVDVLLEVKRAGGRPPRLRLDCGLDDPLLGVNRELRDALRRAGIAHRYEEFPGAHNWDYWHTRLPASLRFFDDLVREAAR